MAHPPSQLGKSKRRLRPAGFVAVGLTAVLIGCGFQALLTLDLTWQPAGTAAALRCDDAGVSTVVVSLFENGADSEPSGQVTLLCSAWSEQTLLVAPGTLPIRVQGLNEEGAICYEDLRSVTFTKREDHRVQWTVVESTDGRANGCSYP